MIVYVHSEDLKKDSPYLDTFEQTMNNWLFPQKFILICL